MQREGIILMVPAIPEFERRVLEAVGAAEERREPPLMCVMEVRRCVREYGMEVPSVDLGQVLVSNLCFKNNTPAMWKLLDQALVSGLVVPVHVLALLTARVPPNRGMQPEAYGLYLDLLDRYILSFSSLSSTPHLNKLIKSVDEILQLSSTYGIVVNDTGLMIVSAFFSMIINLMNCIVEDDRLQLDTKDIPDEKHMDIDESVNDKRNERRKVLCRGNALTAVKILEKIMMHKRATILLRLFQLNMPAEFNCLLQRLQYLKGQIATSQTPIPAKHVWAKICENICTSVHKQFLFSSSVLVGALIGTHKLPGCYFSGAGHSACWVTYDVFFENAMDGRHLVASSAIVILTELTKTLQVINQASWQQTFEALWLSALRLVQREHEHEVEGPIPRLDSRLCLLLSITPLAISAIIKEKESCAVDTSRCMVNYENCSEESLGSTRSSLIHSLQQLQLFTGLLSPPPSVVAAANDAATKAAVFISDFKMRNASFDGKIHNRTSVKAMGSMLHLIVEACVSRNLIDTSAYFWPGYVVLNPAPPKDTSIQESPWVAFMEGAQLSGSLKKSLTAIPASSLEQVEKMYNIALNGSDEERLAAATILCGASLSRGWNIQEHVVHFVVKLLTLPVPPDFMVPNSHLIASMPMLHSVLLGASSIDVVHIISLFGMVPELAASLMPLCETLGSLPPASINPEGVKDETSVYAVFSCAFLCLLRLWKFYRPPQEHNIAGLWGTVRPELNLDYLLLMRNSHISCRSSASGLRDIVDFLPACFAVIISYLSAEITRGIWKPVEMNGIDWPSPASNLASIESEIREMLASAGVDVSGYAGMKPPIMLPLPMVALLSLTITFKLDKETEYIQGVAGPALENSAACCRWPSMPIVSALWAQKVRRWHGFIVFSCARYPFTKDRDAISQLLRSCFASFLGPLVISSDHLSCQHGINALLGHAFSENGTMLPVPPGFLYIHSCRKFDDPKYLTNEIIKYVINFSHEVVSGWSCGGPSKLSSSKTSLVSATVGVKEIGMLGATLLCISGGVRLVQLLYMEVVATWLLSKHENKGSLAVPASFILEGCTLAYFIFLSGSLVWGVGDGTPSAMMTCRSRRARAISVHMDFLAGAAAGGISLGCDPLTWKAYMSFF